MIIGLLDFFHSKDNRTESESEKIGKSCLLSEIISHAKLNCIYLFSKNRTSFWEAFLLDEFFA